MVKNQMVYVPKWGTGKIIGFLNGKIVIQIITGILTGRVTLQTSENVKESYFISHGLPVILDENYYMHHYGEKV